jgi:hypothetical protein
MFLRVLLENEHTDMTNLEGAFLQVFATNALATVARCRTKWNDFSFDIDQQKNYQLRTLRNGMENCPATSGELRTEMFPEPDQQ